MTRLEKYEIFKQFYAKSREYFTEINTNYKTYSDLREAHGFHVFPGSRNGGKDTTVVDICFGLRTYRTYQKIEKTGVSTQADIANGSSLMYYQIDNGNILVNLYPAFTEKHKTQSTGAIYYN